MKSAEAHQNVGEWQWRWHQAWHIEVCSCSMCHGTTSFEVADEHKRSEVAIEHERPEVADDDACDDDACDDDAGDAVDAGDAGDAGDAVDDDGGDDEQQPFCEP